MAEGVKEEVLVVVFVGVKAIVVKVEVSLWAVVTPLRLRVATK